MVPEKRTQHMIPMRFAGDTDVVEGGFEGPRVANRLGFQLGGMKMRSIVYLQ